MHQHPLKLVALCAAFSVLYSSLVAQIPDADPVLRRDTVFEFSWGGIRQLKMSQQHQFRDSLTMLPSQFRQLWWAVPQLVRIVGTGTESQTHFDHQYFDSTRLRVNGELLVFSRIDLCNGQRAASLESKWWPLAQRGAIFTLQIPLDPGKTGLVTIRIVDPGVGESSLTSNRWLGPVLATTEDLTGFRWGPHLNLEQDRDFLTVDEWWATVQPQPEFTFSGKEVRKMRCTIQLTARTKTPMGWTNSKNYFFECSNLTEYQEFLTELNAQQNAFTAGSSVQIEFKDLTSEMPRVAPDLTLKITLVANDDPRKDLRRSTDAHHVRIRLGNREETYNGLYLCELVTPQGDTVDADEPLRLTWDESPEQFQSVLDSWPQVWVDNQPAAVDSIWAMPIFQDTVVAWFDKVIALAMAGEKNPFLRHLKIWPVVGRQEGWPEFFTQEALKSSNALELNLNSWRVDRYNFKALQVRVVRSSPAQKNLSPLWKNECDSKPEEPRARFVGLDDRMSVEELRKEVFIELDEPMYLSIRVATGDPEGEQGFSGTGTDYKFPAGRRPLVVPVYGLQRLSPGLASIYLITDRGVTKKQVWVTP